MFTRKQSRAQSAVKCFGDQSTLRPIWCMLMDKSESTLVLTVPSASFSIGSITCFSPFLTFSDIVNGTLINFTVKAVKLFSECRRGALIELYTLQTLDRATPRQLYRHFTLVNWNTLQHCWHYSNIRQRIQCFIIFNKNEFQHQNVLYFV